MARSSCQLPQPVTPHNRLVGGLRICLVTPLGVHQGTMFRDEEHTWTILAETDAEPIIIIFLGSDKCQARCESSLTFVEYGLILWQLQQGRVFS